MVISFAPCTWRSRADRPARMVGVEPEARLPRRALVSWVSGGTTWYGFVVSGRIFDPFVEGSIFARRLFGEGTTTSLSESSDVPSTGRED